MNRRGALVALVLLPGSFAVQGADVVVANGDALRRLLIEGHAPLVLQPIAALQGCGSDGCVVRLDDLTVQRDRKTLLGDDERPIPLVAHVPGKAKDLPAMRWDPLQAFTVLRSGDTWGTCVEFAHEGVGSSGNFQRWRTVVLVPKSRTRTNAKRVAHRFVGYWTGCDSLVDGSAADEVVLPLVEPIATRQAQLHLVWWHCTPNRCRVVTDPRPVDRAASGEQGALSVGDGRPGKR